MPERSSSTPIDRALADVLVAAYKGKRLNQASLVKATGITVATMQRLMAGKSRFDVDQLFAIADAIGSRTAAEYMREAEENLAREERMSGGAANVTHINSKKGDEWQGEDHALDEWDAAAKRSDTVMEINPDDVTP